MLLLAFEIGYPQLSMQQPAASVHARARSLWERPRPLMLLAGVLAALAFVGTIGFSFVFDDEVVIVNNPTVHAWRYVPQYFTGVFGSHLGPHIISYYRPLFLLWFRIHHALFGLNPLWYHLSNVLVHALVTMLVFSTAVRLTRDNRLAFVAALFFALHPVHVENVAWISCSSETLLALAMLGAFVSWLKSREQRSRCWLVLSVLLYAAAVLEKEPGIVLPGLVFLYVLFYAQQEQAIFPRIRAAVAATLPFWPVALCYVLIRAAATKGLMPHSTTALSFKTMVLTWPSMLAFYGQHLLYSLDTSTFYDFFAVTTPGLRNFVLPLIGLVAFLTLIAIWAHRSVGHRREILFCTVWMFLTIAPALYIRIFLPNDYVHPRYLYMPSVGFVVLLAVFLNTVTRHLSSSARTTILCAVCVLMFFGTFTEQSHWRNNLLLYGRSVQIAPHNPVARNNFANELLARRYIPEAISQYEQILTDHPDFWLANYNLGRAFAQTNSPDRAIAYLDRAITILPTDADEYYFRAVANLQLGKRDDALRDLQQAVNLAPNNASYRSALDRLRAGTQPDSKP